MTCDGEGKLIESGQCESTLNGNPGCPLIDCLPEGMFFFLTNGLGENMKNTSSILIYMLLCNLHRHLNY